MPFKLEWHATLPLLILTLQGTLSGSEYNTLCKERRDLLDKASQRVIVLADVRQMNGVADLSRVAWCAPTLDHPRVRMVLVVLPDSLFRLMRRAVEDTHPYDCRVQFFHTVEAALDYAERLLES